MIKIVADTSCCLPVKLMQYLKIDFVPQIITFQNKSYRDDFELSTEEFLEKLRSSSQLPGTAAPPPALYNPIYERILADGDTVVVLAPSSKVSGTVRSATVAAEGHDKSRIHVIDTELVAGNLGTLVLHAIKWAEDGMDVGQLTEKVKEMSSRNETYFLVPTLEYLHKGGRIGGASKLMGTMLQIVPILTLKNGQVEAHEKVRSLRYALRYMVELNVSICEGNPDAHLTIGSCNSTSSVNLVTEQLKQKLGLSEIPEYTPPPAIVVHAGPGLIVTSCFSKPN